MSIKTRILLLASAVVILLAAVGFYVFGFLNKETKSVTTVGNVQKTPVEKKIVEKVEFSNPLSSTPATGPETIALFLLIPAGIIGWNLRKHSPASF